MIDEEKYNKILEENETLKKQNNNLLRILREKSNKERDLRPKSRRSGYIVLFSKSRSSNLVFNGQILNTWETTMQTPYTIEFDYANVIDMIINDLLDSTNSICLILGIEQYKFIKYEKLEPLDRTKINTLFKYDLCANYRTGYWEIALSHTLPAKVPAELKFIKK